MLHSTYARLLLVVLILVIVGGGVVAYLLKDSIGQTAPDTSGVIAGQVTLSPTCPAETEGAPCATSDLYQGREVVVYATSVLKREIARTRLSPFGEYRLDLLPGEYTLDITYIGVDTSKELPKQITVEKGKITTFNFTIDTGIR